MVYVGDYTQNDVVVVPLVVVLLAVVLPGVVLLDAVLPRAIWDVECCISTIPAVGREVLAGGSARPTNSGNARGWWEMHRKLCAASRLTL